MIKSIIIGFIKYFPYLLILIAGIAISVWGIGYYSQKKTIAELEESHLKKDSVITASISLILNQRDVIDSSRTEYQSLVDNRVSVKETITRYVNTVTERVKRDTVNRILGTGGIRLVVDAKGDTLTAYTKSQNDLITSAVLELQTLRRQQDTTDKARAVYEAINKQTSKRIDSLINRELTKKYLFGIGYKRGLRRLRLNVENVIRSVP